MPKGVYDRSKSKLSMARKRKFYQANARKKTNGVKHQEVGERKGTPRVLFGLQDGRMVRYRLRSIRTYVFMQS